MNGHLVNGNCVEFTIQQIRGMAMSVKTDRKIKSRNSAGLYFAKTAKITVNTFPPTFYPINESLYFDTK